MRFLNFIFALPRVDEGHHVFDVELEHLVVPGGVLVPEDQVRHDALRVVPHYAQEVDALELLLRLQKLLDFRRLKDLCVDGLVVLLNLGFRVHLYKRFRLWL